MKTILTLSSVVFLGFVNSAMATSYADPTDRVVESPNGHYSLEINTKTSRHEIRKGKEVLWSFERRIWHDEFYLSNDGQRVLWVAWEHMQVVEDGKGWRNRQADEAQQEEAIVVYSPDGVLVRKTFAEVSAPIKPAGPGPIGDFWRVWRGTKITREDDVISIPVEGKNEDFKIDLSKTKKLTALMDVKVRFQENPIDQYAERSSGAPGAVIIANYTDDDYASLLFEVTSIERLDKLPAEKRPEFYEMSFREFRRRSRMPDRYNLLEIEIGKNHDREGASREQAVLYHTLRDRLKKGSSYILAWPTTEGVTAEGLVLPEKIGGMDGLDLQVFDYNEETLRDIDTLFPKALKEARDSRDKKIIPQKINPDLLSGMKILIAFDHYQRDPEAKYKQFLATLDIAGLKVLDKYGSDGYFLLECDNKDPDQLMKKISHHEGAMLFKDGAVQKTYSTFDGKRTVGENCAMIIWGGSSAALRQSRIDIATYDNMEGVVSQYVDPIGGKGGSGCLKLQPAEDTTLLQIFLWSKGKFEYTPEK